MKKGKGHIRAREENYLYIDRHASKPGMLSVVIGAVSLVGLLILCVISYACKGNGAMWLGAIGLLLFFSVIAGLILAISAFRDREIEWKFPMIGLISNGILLCIYLTLYIFGTIS